jgi:hypothetical protein
MLSEAESWSNKEPYINFKDTYKSILEVFKLMTDRPGGADPRVSELFEFLDLCA